MAAPGFDVHPRVWVASGRDVADAADGLGRAVDALCGVLAGTDGCWGSDELGRAFFDGQEDGGGFKAARDQVLSDLAGVVNVVRAMGLWLQDSGRRYTAADEASTVGLQVPGWVVDGRLGGGDLYRLPGVTGGLAKSDPAPVGLLWVVRLLELLVGGCEWPDGSEAQLGTMARGWQSMASALRNAAERVRGDAGAVTSEDSGEATSSFATFAENLVKVLEGLAQGCGQLAGSSDDLLKLKLAARMQFKLSCVFLAATWALAYSLSGVTFGGSLGAATATTEAEGWALRAFLLRLVGFVKPVLMGAWFGAGLDSAGQISRINYGLADGFDAGEFWKSVGEGGIAGGVMGVGGRWLAGGAQDSLRGGLRQWTASGGWQGVVGRWAPGGTFATLGNGVAQGVFEGGHVDWGQAAVFGFGMGGLEEAKHAGRQVAARVMGMPSAHVGGVTQTAGADGVHTDPAQNTTENTTTQSTTGTGADGIVTVALVTEVQGESGVAESLAGGSSGDTGGDGTVTRGGAGTGPGGDGQPDVPGGGGLPSLPQGGHLAETQVAGVGDPVTGAVAAGDGQVVVPAVSGREGEVGGQVAGVGDPVTGAVAAGEGQVVVPAVPGREGEAGGVVPVVPAHPDTVEVGAAGPGGVVPPVPPARGGGEVPAPVPGGGGGTGDLAHEALRRARQIVAPDGLVLQDGSVRLTDSGGRAVRIGEGVLRQAEAGLAVRAAEGVSFERLRAEAAAWIGEQVARSSRTPAAEGALEGLARLMDQVPGDAAAARLSRQIRAEHPDARLPAGDRLPPDARLRPDLHDGAARDIVERATALAAPQIAEAPEQHGAAALTRPLHADGLTLGEVHAALDELRPSDFGRGVTEWRWSGENVIEVVSEFTGTVRINVEIHPLVETVSTLEHGRFGQPERLRIAPSVISRQALEGAPAAETAGMTPERIAQATRMLPQILQHGITDAVQHAAAEHARSEQGMIRRLATGVRLSLGDPARVERLINDHRYLTRQWRETTDPAERARLALEIRQTGQDLRTTGHTPPQPPWVEGSDGHDPANPPLTPHQRLTAHVHELTATLDRDVTTLDEIVDAHNIRSDQAAERAVDALADSLQARRDNDPVTERRLAAQSEIHLREARRHTEHARDYQEASDAAHQARTSYRALLSNLDHTAEHADRGADRFMTQTDADAGVLLATEAHHRLTAYATALDTALHPEITTSDTPHLPGRDAPAPMAVSFGDTPLAELGAQARQHVDALARDAEALDERVLAKMASAEKAGGDADKAFSKALEAAQHDATAHERLRRELARGDGELRRSSRHSRIALRYQEALDRAREARWAYEALRDAIDQAAIAETRAGGARDRAALDEAEALARTAQERLDEYRAALAETVPPNEVLTTSMPTGRMPHLTALTEAVNRALERNGVDRRYAPDQLQYLLRREWRKVVGPDGAVVPVGTEHAGELRIRLTAGELAEVLDPPMISSEMIIGDFPQGGQTTAATINYARNVPIGGDLSLLARLFPPGSLIRKVARWVDPGVKIELGRQRSVTGGALEHARYGGVEDIRGEATLFDAEVAWTVDVRTSHKAGWRSTEEVTAGGENDATSLNVFISHAYTAGAPERTIRLPAGEQTVFVFPEHTANGMTNLEELADKMTAALGADYDAIGKVSWDQSHTMVREETTNLAYEALNDPDGLQRLMTGGDGRLAVNMRLKSTLVMDRTRLYGESTPDHWGEALRIGFSGSTGSESHGTSLGLTGQVKISPGLNDVDVVPGSGHYGIDAGFLLKGSRVVAYTDSSSVNNVAIHVGVHRNTGHSQGYLLTVRHEMVFERADGTVLPPITVESTVLVRIPEAVAARAGFPVDENAIVRNASGEALRHPDGSIVLRGDPVPLPPDGHVGAVPTWIGNGPDQLRGAGPAQVEDFVGGVEIRHVLEKLLREQAILPQLRDDRMPVMPDDPLVLASHVAVLRTVEEQLAARRQETGYDPLSQDGGYFDLVFARTGHVPQHALAHVWLEQHFDQAVYENVGTHKAVVNLDIGSDNVSHAHTRTRSGNVTGGAYADHSMKPGEGGFAPGAEFDVGGNLSFTEGGSKGYVKNRVSITETTGQVGTHHIPHTVHAQLIYADGTVSEVVSMPGSARVSWSADMMPRLETPFSAGVDRAPSPKVLGLATFQHVDVKGMVAALTELLPRTMRPDSPAFHKLVAHFGPRGLIAHPEWMHTPYGTETAVRPQGMRPVQAKVYVTGEIHDAEVVGKTTSLTGNIDLTLSTAGATSGRSYGWTGSGSVHGVLHWARVLRAAFSVDGSHTRGWTHFLTKLAIWGRERLGIEVGLHYIFKAKVDFHLTGEETGHHGEPVVLPDRPILYTLPERHALEQYTHGVLPLPLDLVADAVDRVLHDNLSVDRHLAGPLISRYLGDLGEAARRGEPVPDLSAHHTPDVLADKLMTMTGLDVHVTEPGAEHRLNAVLDEARRLAALPREVVVADHLAHKIGTSLIEDVDFGPGWTDKKVHEAVEQAVMNASPNALARDPMFRQGLRDLFGGPRWRGNIDMMLDPWGFAPEFVVRVGGGDTGRTELITVQARIELGDRAQAVGSAKDVVMLLQDYHYGEIDKSDASFITNALGAGGGGGRGKEGVNGHVGTSRSQAHTGTSGEQDTRMQRYGDFGGLDRVKQDAKITITVTRTPVRDGRVRAAVRHLLDDKVHAGTPDPEPVVLTGTVTRLLPTGLVRPADGPLPAKPESLPDLRTADLFGVKTFVSSVDAPQAFEVMRDVLTGRDMLGAGAARAVRAQLVLHWSEVGRSATLEQTLGENGRRFRVFSDTRHADVTIRARLWDAQVLEGPAEVKEFGEVDRIQRTTGWSVTNGRPGPVSRSVDGGGTPAALDVGRGTGAQSSEVLSESGGGRRETSGFERSLGVAVGLRVTYDITFDRGGEHVVRTVGGTTVVRMPEHEFRAMRERLERDAGAPHAAPPATVQGTGQGTPRTSAPAPTWRIVDADPANPSAALTQARMEARLNGSDVRIEVRVPGQEPHRYRAGRDGSLVSEDAQSDGGFAAAFAGLPPDLPALADRYGIDLRQVFELPSTLGTFTERLSTEFARRGIAVPAAPTPVWPVPRELGELDPWQGNLSNQGGTDMGGGGIVGGFGGG